MRCHLADKDIQVVIDVLKQFSGVECAWVFGSRVLGTHELGSDVDIAVQGESLSRKDVSRIHMILEEETILPYKFDVLHYNNLSNEDLLHHIENHGVQIYSV